MSSNREPQTTNDTSALVEGILAEAEEKITKVLREAQEYETRRLSAAKAQADALLVEAGKEASIRAAEILASAEAKLAMEKTRGELRFRETLMREAVNLARLEFGKARERPDYRQRLVRWIAEAAIGVGGQDIVLDAGEYERSLITEEALREAEKLARSAGGIETKIRLSDRAPLAEAGIYASSSDGRIVYDNTAEARFSRMESKIRSVVREELEAAGIQADGKAAQS